MRYWQRLTHGKWLVRSQPLFYAPVSNTPSIAMERATYSSKSFLIGLALTLRHITAEEASLASHVEVNSQIEKWGEVEDCTCNR